MHPLRPSMTVEEAVAHFSPGSAEVQEVYNEEDEFVGYLTVESISLAMQRGELTRPILEFVVPEVSLQDQEQQTSSRSQLHAFFKVR